MFLEFSWRVGWKTFALPWWNSEAKKDGAIAALKTQGVIWDLYIDWPIAKLNIPIDFWLEFASGHVHMS